MTPTSPRPRSDKHDFDHHSHDAHHARHGHAEHDGLYNEDVAHEEADVNIRQLITYTIGLVLMSVISAGIVWGLFPNRGWSSTNRWCSKSTTRPRPMCSKSTAGSIRRLVWHACRLKKQRSCCCKEDCPCARSSRRIHGRERTRPRTASRPPGERSR